MYNIISGIDNLVKKHWPVFTIPAKLVLDSDRGEGLQK